MTRSLCVALSIFGLQLVACGGGGGASSGAKGGGGSGGTSPTAKADMAGTTTHTDMGTTTMPSDMGNAVVDMAPAVIGADKCSAATYIDTDAAMSYSLATSTKKATHDLNGSCGNSTGADVFFTFTLHERELVYADTFGATWNTSLFFASDCDTPLSGSVIPGDSLCSDDACGTSQSQVVALLNPGVYYLVLSGKGTGDATIHFQHALVGRGPLALLPQGTSAPSGTTSGNGSSFECMGAAAENSYWWTTCSSFGGGTFTGSLCGGATWDTVAYLQMPGAKNEICANDVCGLQSSITQTLPAGGNLYVFTVDGATSGARGDYTVTFNRP